MQIILYKTPTCPQCKVIKLKLEKKGLAYTEITDSNIMEERGIHSVPQLQIDDNPPMVGIKTINDWINSQEAANNG